MYVCICVCAHMCGYLHRSTGAPGGRDIGFPAAGVTDGCEALLLFTNFHVHAVLNPDHPFPVNVIKFEIKNKVM